MSDMPQEFKSRISLAVVLGVSLVGIVGAAFLFGSAQKSKMAASVSALLEEKARLSQDAQKLQKLLSAKEEALLAAQKNNYQADLLTAQSALKDANEKLAQMIREKANAGNSNINLDNRLKNTTLELTRTLEELKKAREALGGVDGQHRVKIAQLMENIKNKDEQLQKFQQQLKQKEGAVVDVRKREIEASDVTRRYQSRILELEKNVASMNKLLDEKERQLSQAAKTGGRTQAASSASFEKERFNLERQIADSSAKLFDQQEQLKEMEKKVADMNKDLSERELTLAKRERELSERTSEIGILKNELLALRSASYQSSESSPILSETQRELSSKVRMLEAEKRSLQERLSAAQKDKAGLSGRAPKDMFADRNFRILTETLAMKEDQIKQMESEMAALKKDKALRESGAGMKETRLAELGLLVNTLTKQLGEYAGLIEKKDIELKAAQEKLAAIMQELEAQKMASITLQRDLADARSRQEKTFQSLTQIMNMNTEGAINPVEAAPEYTYDTTATAESDEDVQKRADELRRKVEVMLEDKEK